MFDPDQVKRVWVIFDRGRDIALVLAFNGSAKSETSHGDIDVDPARGLGRALLTTLSQFADATTHQELALAPLILQGLSGAGVLVARFPEQVPERLVAVATANPVTSLRLVSTR